MPGVIYLPESKGGAAGFAGSAGTALGMILGQMWKQRREQGAIEESKALPEADRPAYLASHIDPEFALTLARIQQGQASMEASKAETAKANVATSLARLQLANYPQNQQLQTELTRAQIGADRARTVGNAAETALATLKVEQLKKQLDQQENMNRLISPLIQQQIEGLVGAPSAVNPAAPRGGAAKPLTEGDLEGDLPPGMMPSPQEMQDAQKQVAAMGLPQPSGTSPGAPSGSIPGAPPAPQSSPSPAPTQAAATGVPGPGGVVGAQVTPAAAIDLTTNEEDKGAGANTPEMLAQLSSMKFGSKPLDASAAASARDRDLARARLLQTQSLAAQAFEPEKAAVMTERAQALASRAQENYKKATSPLPGSESDVEISPGIKARVGTFADGQQRIIRVNDTRKVSVQDVKQMPGLVQWAGTMQGLDAITDKQIASGEKGGIFDRVKKGIAVGLTSAGITPPAGLTEGDPLFQRDAALWGHNVIGVMNLASGTGRGKAIIERLADLAPKPTDSSEIRKAKIAAADLAFNLNLKTRVELDIENGNRVPQLMMKLYKDRHLEQDLGVLAAQYAQQARSAGIDPAAYPLPMEAAPGVTKEQVVPSRSGAPAPSSGWTVQEVPGGG